MCELNKPKAGTIAYILKNFPKLSETFIASEIYRMEKLGADLKLFVIKPPTENLKHDLIEKIKAPRFYLPATESLSEMRLVKWLKIHFKGFRDGLFNVIKRKPLAVLKAAKFAFVQAVRARKGFFAFPRKVYLKEFLQAAAIADQILRDGNIRHLHAHFAHGATTVAWMVSIITGLRFSFTAHAKDIYLESLNPAGLLGRKMDAAEFVVTCTQANRKHLQSLSQTPVHCLYHGLNTEFAGLSGKRSGGDGGRLRALAVGRLVPKKGLDVFVEACGILQKRQVNFMAQIVGETGELEPKLKSLIEKHKLQEAVTLTGAMTQNSLFREYNRADVFCLPCRITENGDRDGIPNVMVEAMWCRVPVISTAVSGIPEIIRNGENGLLVETENPIELADSMQRIHEDKFYAERLGEAGRRTVQKNFDGDISARKLKKLLDRFLIPE
ncbi:MAG: glycosyltransferase [Pyrinomonadaceae bacterium]